jgi:hypothetical protein
MRRCRDCRAARFNDDRRRPIEYALDGVSADERIRGSARFRPPRCRDPEQDPDIIMIGEIRDLETAQIACKLR